MNDKLQEEIVKNLIESKFEDNIGKYYLSCRVMIDKYTERERSYDIAIIDNRPEVIIPENDSWEEIETTYFDSEDEAKSILKRINMKEIERQILEDANMDFDYIIVELWQVSDKYSASRVD